LGGYGAGILFEFLAVIVFVVCLVICYAVVLVKNSKRDVYHQIPFLRAFLYATGLTLAVLVCIVFAARLH
jgi:hypothetical protein